MRLAWDDVGRSLGGFDIDASVARGLVRSGFHGLKLQGLGFMLYFSSRAF